MNRKNVGGVGMTEKSKIPSATNFKKLVWFVKMTCRKARAWIRSQFSELRELDAFRKCVRLERKAVEYPRAVPLLTELMNAYRETGQDERRLEVMRRLRDIEPRPIPEFMWDEQPPVKIWLNNVEAWCAKIERLIKERCMKAVHPRHVQNFLRISYGNAAMVCDALHNRGILGPYDAATGRHRVLIASTGQ